MSKSIETTNSPDFNFSRVTSNAKGYPFVELCSEKLYVDLFGNVPSAYYANFCYGDAGMVDFKNLNSENLKSAYLDAFGKESDDVRVVIRRTRKNDEYVVRGDKKTKIKYGLSIYVNERCVSSSFLVIDKDNKIIVNGDKNSVEVYYESEDADFDYVGACDRLWDFLPITKNEEIEKEPHVLLVASGPGGVDTIPSAINDTTIDVRKTYNDDFAPVYENIKDFIESENRTCGMVILNGEPGTGKTTMLRDLISHSDKKFLFIPPALSNEISSPQFVKFMLDNANSIFIMEDCEKAIQKRDDGGYLSSVASILNMSDGILGDIYNIKFICTFNSDLEKIDPALLRKGRCVAKYTFEKLNKEKAKALLNERGIELDEYEDMTLADIFHYGEDNGTDMPKKKKIGF